MKTTVYKMETTFNEEDHRTKSASFTGQEINTYNNTNITKRPVKTKSLTRNNNNSHYYNREQMKISLERKYSSASKECIMHNSVLTEDTKTLTSLLSNNQIDIDHYNQDGFTSLHQACIIGNITTVRLLIEAGADINLLTRCKRKALAEAPLGLASMNGNFEVAEYLLAKGAKDDGVREGMAKKIFRAHRLS